VKKTDEVSIAQKSMGYRPGIQELAELYSNGMNAQQESLPLKVHFVSIY
jgi:hypothetical protein